MTAGAFSRFCIYMIMAQMVFSLIAAAAELILNQLGLSMDTLTELASVGSDMGIMMMIYAGFVGPVVEELVFRGFLMRRFEKYGKGFDFSSLYKYVKFHQEFPQILDSLRPKSGRPLSWTHYRILLQHAANKPLPDGNNTSRLCHL